MLGRMSAYFSAYGGTEQVVCNDPENNLDRQRGMTRAIAVERLWIRWCADWNDGILHCRDVCKKCRSLCLDLSCISNFESLTGLLK